MKNSTAGQLPTKPCAQSYNTWNPSHRAHNWLCKQEFPEVDARCPGSVLKSRTSAR